MTNMEEQRYPVNIRLIGVMHKEKSKVWILDACNTTAAVMGYFSRFLHEMFNYCLCLLINHFPKIVDSFLLYFVSAIN